VRASCKKTGTWFVGKLHPFGRAVSPSKKVRAVSPQERSVSFLKKKTSSQRRKTLLLKKEVFLS